MRATFLAAAGKEKQKRGHVLSFLTMGKYKSAGLHFLDFFNDPRIIREQRIAANWVIEGGGDVKEARNLGQPSSDRSQSGTEDDLTLQSVYDLCVSLCKHVTAQAVNIKDLKAQIKKLKKKARLVINHHKSWIKSLSMKKRLARKKKMESVRRGPEAGASGSTLRRSSQNSISI
ncbi:hypothetical protein Tco_0425825 [Tanacetum coccineum]